MVLVFFFFFFLFLFACFSLSFLPIVLYVFLARVLHVLAFKSPIQHSLISFPDVRIHHLSHLFQTLAHFLRDFRQRLPSADVAREQRSHIQLFYHPFQHALDVFRSHFITLHSRSRVSHAHPAIRENNQPFAFSPFILRVFPVPRVELFPDEIFRVLQFDELWREARCHGLVVIIVVVKCPRKMRGRIPLDRFLPFFTPATHVFQR
mmetsp:Transcript_1872/g.5992  ORF Transcript_1872/g.5992 Transcript_1872/m.5992 type:complete len:206 (+) Transcript_1872:167-784(+)